LEADPVNNEIRAQLWACKAWAEKRLGQFEEALESIRKAVDLEPANASYNYNLACYAKLSGELDTAYKSLENATNLEPGFRSVAEIDTDWEDLKNSDRFKRLVS
jgi:Flp pilus assembly protein TadD